VADLDHDPGIPTGREQAIHEEARDPAIAGGLDRALAAPVAQVGSVARLAPGAAAANAEEPESAPPRSRVRYFTGSMISTWKVLGTMVGRGRGRSAVGAGAGPNSAVAV